MKLHFCVLAAALALPAVGYAGGVAENKFGPYARFVAEQVTGKTGVVEQTINPEFAAVIAAAVNGSAGLRSGHEAVVTASPRGDYRVKIQPQ